MAVKNGDLPCSKVSIQKNYLKALTKEKAYETDKGRLNQKPQTSKAAALSIPTTNHPSFTDSSVRRKRSLMPTRNWRWDGGGTPSMGFHEV